MKKAGLLYVALLSIVGALVLALERRRRRGEADQGCVDLRRPAQRRRLVTGARRRPALRPEDARQEGRHDVQGERPRGPADAAGDRRARARRQQDHLRRPSASWTRWLRRRSTPTSTSSTRRVQVRQELRELLRRRRGRDLPRRHGGGRRDEERQRRVHRAVPDPRDHPARERLRARRARRPAGREDPARLDEVLVRPGEGAEGRGEPRRRRRRRDRPERRQPVRGPVRADEGHPVGGSRVEREEVRADLLAHVRAVRLGPLLPQARQGGPERHLEDRELLGKHGRRLRGARSFGPKVSAKTRA